MTFSVFKCRYSHVTKHGIMSNIMTCLSKAPDNVLWLMEAQHHCCSGHALLKPCSLLKAVTVCPQTDLSPARDYPVWSSSRGFKLAADIVLVPWGTWGDTATLSQGKDLDLREAASCKRVSFCNAEGIQRQHVASLGADRELLQVCSLLIPVLWLRRCVEYVYMIPTLSLVSVLNSGFVLRLSWFGLGIFVCWVFSYKRLA